MSDHDQRADARRGHQDPEAAARAWRGRLRAEGLRSHLTPERVRLTAFLGDARCRRLEGWSPCCCVAYPCRDDCLARQNMPLTAWLSALERLAGAVRTGRRVACPPPCPDEYGCAQCHGTGTVLATEACPPPCPDEYGCAQCNGTGRVPETLRTRAMVLAAAACAKRCLWAFAPTLRLRGQWRQWQAIKSAIRAARAWALDPSEESLRTWDDTHLWARGPRWLPCPPVEVPGEDLGPRRDYAQTIQAAARQIGHGAARDAICAALIPWLLEEQ